MSVRRFRSTLALLMLSVCAFTLNTFGASKRKHAKPSPAKQEQPTPAVVEVPSPPPAQLTLEQKPAVAPKVTYQNRQLMIVAENSTLGDILRAVKAQTGASIELPPNANSRVVANLGPGPSRDVLASLLNGTLFNYMLLGTVNDPSAVGKIILTQKPTGPDAQAAAVNPQPNMMGQQQNSFPVANLSGQSGDEQDADSETETETSTDQPEAQGAPANAQQQNLRTPEQLLQELQRQQQLQQQMQQQQGNPQPNQVPPPNPQE